MNKNAMFKRALSARTFSLLWRHNLHSVKALAGKSKREILMMRGFGLVTFGEIREALRSCGVDWPTKQDWPQ